MTIIHYGLFDPVGLLDCSINNCCHTLIETVIEMGDHPVKVVKDADSKCQVCCKNKDKDQSKQLDHQHRKLTDHTDGKRCDVIYDKQSGNTKAQTGKQTDPAIYIQWQIAVIPPYRMKQFLHGSGSRIFQDGTAKD